MTHQPPAGQVEQAAGVKGRFIVYYRRNGQRYWDAIYSPTAEQAERDFHGIARELGWTVDVERVEVRA